MALHTNLPIYRTGTELLAMGYVIQRDMPRGFKRSLGEKIVQGCTDMLELMALANATRSSERAANIERLLVLIRATTVTLRVGHDLRAIPTKQWSAAVLLLEKVGAQAGGWLKFVGHVIKPWRRTTRPRTLATALQRVGESPTEQLTQAANSYFGLLRQASHSHADRARLANVVRRRGKSVKADLTKTYTGTSRSQP